MARPTLDRCPKYKVLIRRLALPKPYIRGLLETLWDVANECGNPILGDAETVEAAAEWPETEKAGRFFEALRDGGWIDQTEDGKWEIHDYWDHAPEYVKGRFRKERERKRKRESEDVTRQSRDSHATVAKKSDTPTPTPTPKEETPGPAEPAAVPKGLIELIDGWNALGSDIVHHGNGARMDSPAKAILAGWKRAQSNREQRAALQDIPAVLAAIRKARFCHGKGWFSLPWLFATNEKGEYNVVRVMAGLHNGDSSANSQNGTAPAHEPIVYANLPSLKGNA